MKRDLAIVLLSGGMDSCVTAAIANENYNLAFLHVNYGQLTERRELKAFNEISDYYKVNIKLIVNLEHLSKIGGSSLTDHSIKVPLADLHRSEIPSSYVPFRNANMLSVAVSWAEVIGAKRIFIGVVEEDSSGYPDCRKNFIDAFNKVIDFGTKPDTKIIVETPIISFKKSEIVRKGIELKAPLHLSWSCYKDEEIACGICDSCALRLRAFRQAGVIDPLPYRRKPEYI